MDIAITNDIEIKLPVRGELGRVRKDDLCIAVQSSSRQQLVSELKNLMQNDAHFSLMYSHQFRAWTVSVNVATYFIRHIYGGDCKIQLVK